MTEQIRHLGYNETCKKHFPYAIRRKTKNKWEILNRDYSPLTQELITLRNDDVQILIDNASPISASNGATIDTVDIITIWCAQTFSSKAQLTKLSNCLAVIFTAR